MKKVRFNGRAVSKERLLWIIKHLTYAHIFPVRYYKYEELRVILRSILKDRPNHFLYSLDRFENLQ